MSPFWHLQLSHFSPPLHKSFTFQMPAGTQELQGEMALRGIVWEGWFHQAAGSKSSPPSVLTIHLPSTEREDKSDRVQSLSLICQWGEWVGMRLSDQPTVACRSYQPYWIMTRQNVGRREQRAVDSVRVDKTEKRLKRNLSLCKVCLLLSNEFWKDMIGCDEKVSYRRLEVM